MTVPKLSKASVERLSDVTESAINMIEDSNISPNEALAKSARDHGLPDGHIPLLVRGYNNARTARQLASSKSAWERAESFETADEAGIRSYLGSKKEASEKGLSDYDSPPTPSAVQLATAERTKLPPLEERVKAAYAAFGLSPDEGKENTQSTKASSEGLSETQIEPYESDWRVANNVDEFCELLKVASAGTYSAVKQLALTKTANRLEPIFSYLETKNWFAKAASVKPDAAVGNSHPGLKLMLDIDETVAKTKKPQKEASESKGPLFDLMEKEGGILDPFKAVNNTLINQNLTRAMAGLSERAEANQLLRQKMQEGTTRGPFSPESKLPRELDRINEQDSINSIFADPRMKHADPSQVIDFYNNLRGLAPTIMRNTPVAVDLIHRRIQTGPLSMFDFGQLVKAEKDLVDAQSVRNKQFGD